MQFTFKNKIQTLRLIQPGTILVTQPMLNLLKNEACFILLNFTILSKY